jgi:hypothetical protein
MSQWRHKITHFPQTIALRHPDRLNRLDLHRLQLPRSPPCPTAYSPTMKHIFFLGSRLRGPDESFRTPHLHVHVKLPIDCQCSHSVDGERGTAKSATDPWWGVLLEPQICSATHLPSTPAEAAMVQSIATPRLNCLTCTRRTMTIANTGLRNRSKPSATLNVIFLARTLGPFEGGVSASGCEAGARGIRRVGRGRCTEAR